MASPGHGGRAAPAMVLLVWLIASAPLCAGGRTIGTAEHVAGVQPWHELVARAIASGRLPEWDDASGLGAPLAGDPARPALYPPVWLGGIAPGPLATDALLLLHLLLFGLGVAAWSRRLGAEPVAAAAAGAAALLSGTTLGLLASGGPLYAAAWLPWIGWAAHGIAAQPARGGIGLAAAGGALLLAGPSAPAIAAPLVALAALAARAPRRAGPYLTALAAIAGAFLLAAFALVPAGALGRLAPPPQPAPPLAPTDLAALALAAWAALRPGAGLPARLLLAAGAAAALVALGLNLAPAGFLAAATALVWAVAGAGLSDVLVRLAGRRGAAVGRPRLRAALGALLLAAVVGAPLARAWRALPLAPRAELDAPPAILSGLAAPAPGEPRPRLAWPDPAGRPYGDAPPDTGARFGLAHLPPRDRARDPEL
ncbi:MAG TPA: hypothetical protein VKZ63_14800, partial [Kofleriaceae bacterium]|nr:hypothetical protein [Kofleriaceae bacterium]